jgi:hypothetical protein
MKLFQSNNSHWAPICARYNRTSCLFKLFHVSGVCVAAVATGRDCSKLLPPHLVASLNASPLLITTEKAFATSPFPALLLPRSVPPLLRCERRRREGQGKARQGKARQGKARQGKARQGKARQGKARQGKARQGKARQARKRRELCRPGAAALFAVSLSALCCYCHGQRVLDASLRNCQQPPVAATH